MKTINCLKCRSSIRPCNIEKHFEVCIGTYSPFVKSTNCKYCGIDLSTFKNSGSRANHIRWCIKNPQRNEYIQELKKIGQKPRTSESRQRAIEKIKQAHVDGKYKHIDYSLKKFVKHTEETKEIIRAKALASSHRRLVRSVREYIKKDGTIVKLDSAWEEALAKRLDELNIDWIRPSNPIPWVDKDGVTHNYFPDFYLKEQDVYLDPKNPYALDSQKDKLEVLTKQLKNLIIITSLEDCCYFNFNSKEIIS